jgi:hypothetical protein
VVKSCPDATPPPFVLLSYTSKFCRVPRKSARQKGGSLWGCAQSDFRLALFHKLGDDGLMRTTLGYALLEQEDVDADGDGKYDAWSVAVAFDAVPARIVGYAQK